MFKRSLYQFAAFEHGVELRDAQGVILGETADGSLKVTAANIQLKRSMIGGAYLVHRGGTMMVSPTPSVAPTPGLPATHRADGWYSVSLAMCQQLLRFAA